MTKIFQRNSGAQQPGTVYAQNCAAIARSASRQQSAVAPLLCLAGVLLLALTAFLPVGLQAQSGRTTISGRVVDHTGAMIVGAKVDVVNVETNFTVTLMTNDKGYYEATQLTPGQYKIVVEAAGFAKLTRQGITLVAGTPISIELPLAVGKAEQSLIVTAEAPLLNTEPSSSGQVIATKTLENAPVSSANATLLAKFAEGVTSNYASNWYMAGNLNATGNISNIGSFGQLNKNQFYLDGVANLSYSGNAAYVPSTDEVSEMKTEISGFDVSLGKTLGVSVITTSKPGTNIYHGSLRELYYDRRWESMSHFGSTNYQIQFAKNCSDPTSSACALAKEKYGNPGLIEHNSGATLGGPLFIPKIFNGRDKLFFFVNINRDDYGDAASQTATVPTTQELTGNFSDLCTSSASCGAYQIYDPTSVVYSTANSRYERTAVTGNDLNNVSLLKTLMAANPLATFVAKYMPAPNVSSSGNYAISSNYAYLQIKPTMYHSYVGRLDYTPSQKDRFFARASQSNWTQGAPGYLLSGLDTRNVTFKSALVTAGWTRMFSSSTVLDTSLGYTQWFSIITAPGETAYAPSALGLPSYMDTMASQYTTAHMPLVSFSNYYTTFGQNTTPKALERHLTLRSGLTNVRGSHTFGLGVEARQQLMSGQASANTSGLFTFNNSYVRHYSTTTDSPQSLGLNYAAFLLGIPYSTQYDVPTNYKANNPYFALYAQDSWRIKPRLTMSFGIRYEYEYGPQEARNHEVTEWDPTATLASDFSSVAASNYASLYASTYAATFSGYGLTAPASTINVVGGVHYAGLNGASTKRFNDNQRIMPRIGIAYQWKPSVVIRGGYGLFFDTTNVTNQSINQNGYSRSTVDYSTTDNGMSWQMGNPATGVSPLSDPFYTLTSGARYLAPIGNVLGSNMYIGNSIGSSSAGYYPHDYKPARQQRWVVSIQKQFGSHDSVSFTYNGSWTDHLEWAQNLNAMPGTYYAKSTTPNTAVTTELSVPVTNPFYYANFTALATSNPTLYTQISSYFSGSTTTLAALTKPYPWMGNIYKATNKAAAKYNALNFQWDHRLGKGIQATVNYQRTFQRDKNFTANSYDTDPSWALSNNSLPSRLTLTGHLEVPFGTGRRWLHKGITGKILEGQTFDFSYEAQQGLLIGFGNILYTGSDPSMRDLKLKKPVYVTNTSSGTNYVQWLDTTKVDTTAADQITSTYNARIFPAYVDGVRQMGINNFNVNYQREVSIHGRLKFVGRFEAIDVFNHRIIGTPDTSPTSSTYGRVTADNGSYGRWIQLQGRLSF